MYSFRNLKLHIHRSPNREIITVRSIYSFFICRYKFNSNIPKFLCSNYTSKAKHPKSSNSNAIKKWNGEQTSDESLTTAGQFSHRLKTTESNKHPNKVIGKLFQKPSYKRVVTESKQSNQPPATTQSNVRQNTKTFNQKLSQADVDKYFEKHINQFDKDKVLSPYLSNALLSLCLVNVD